MCQAQVKLSTLPRIRQRGGNACRLPLQGLDPAPLLVLLFPRTIFLCWARHSQMARWVTWSSSTPIRTQAWSWTLLRVRCWGPRGAREGCLGLRWPDSALSPRPHYYNLTEPLFIPLCVWYLKPIKLGAHRNGCSGSACEHTHRFLIFKLQESLMVIIGNNGLTRWLGT